MQMSYNDTYMYALLQYNCMFAATAVPKLKMIIGAMVFCACDCIVGSLSEYVQCTKALFKDGHHVKLSKDVAKTVLATPIKDCGT